MLCERCHEKEAVVTVMEIVDGREKKIRLCRDCAAQGAGGGIAIMQMSAGSVLGGLLSGLLGLPQTEAAPEQEGQEDEGRHTNVICPSCGTTYDEFVKYGTLGCPQCYHSFGFLLERYLEKMQGASRHTGIRPHQEEREPSQMDLQQTADSEDRLEYDDGRICVIVDREAGRRELQAALDRALAREDYEEAARLRDLVSSLGGAYKHA